MSTEHVESEVVPPTSSTEQAPEQEHTTQPQTSSESGTEQKTPNRPPWNWQDALALLGLLLLVVGMVLRYASNITGEIPGEWWDPLLNIWTLSWDTNTLLHNPLHLWQAQLLYPNNLTLSYSENLLGDVIFFAPIYLLTHNPVLAYNVVFYLTFFLCGLNMYIVARHYTGKRLAAFVAALIYAFAPYRLAQIDHIPVVAGEWIPLAFLFLDHSFQQGRWRHWVLFALFFFLQLLTSVYYGIFLAYTLLAYILIRYSRPFLVKLRDQKGTYIRYLLQRAIRPTVVFGIALILLGILMEPYLVSLSNGFSRSLLQSAGYSAFIRDFFYTIPFNKLHGIATSHGEVIPLDGEHFLFLGWTTMALTALGVILAFRRRDKTMRIFAWTGLVVLLFAFGPYLQYSTANGAPLLGGQPMSQPFSPAIPMPWLLAYFVLPGFKGLRVPARLIGVLLMMLALLGAYAIAWLQNIYQASSQTVPQRRFFSLSPTVRGVIISCLLIIVPLALLAEALPSYLPVTHLPTGNAIPAVYQWLETHGGDQPIIELPMAHLDENFTTKQEAYYDYYALYHSHPIANGWSGYRPALTTTISTLMLNFPSQAGLDILKKYHIQYVVFHPLLFLQYDSPDMVAAMLTQMLASPGLQFIAVFGNALSSSDSVWQVK